MAVIGTEEELRALYGAPSQRAAAKVIGHLDRHCRDFIAHSPFMVLATSDGARLDVSPKGDPAGFVQMEDDHHLIVPDRPRQQPDRRPAEPVAQSCRGAELLHPVG